MVDQPTRGRVAVVGAGISGLTAAKKLVDAGYQVDVYEGGNRVGGKIHTIRQADGQVADVAAEFIDSDQENLIQLCKSLNVPLAPGAQVLTTRYKQRDGTMLSDTQFEQAYLPLAQQVNADKKTIAADPMGARAQYLDGISTLQYLKELAASARGVDPAIVDVAAQGFSSERGRPASQISALQFVHEAGKDFIASDCAYRVEGGTKQLIDALRADLEAKGTRFFLNAKVQEVDKRGGKFTLKSTATEGDQGAYDKIVLAAQAHTLAAIDGLDKLGFNPEDLDTLQQLQYTHNTKITIKTKIPIAENGFFMSSAGYQTWNRAPGEVVFLIGDDLPARYKPQALLDHVLEDYARAHGTTADALFDKSQINYNGPNMQKPCYATPAQGQVLRLQRFSQRADELARQGVGIVGTYLPSHAPAGRACGYMAHGVESADRATSLLMQQQRGQAGAEPSFTAREEARRKAVAAQGHQLA